MPSNPPAPTRVPIDPAWPHAGLHERVKEALTALPVHFKTEISISGIMATDLHTLNQVLGAAIEDQVVATLNNMQRSWDPEEQYAHCSFVRQPQTFPDVLLRRSVGSGQPEEVIMGIELKGWYLLAKEREPNFRFTVSPAACNPQDLLVVVPWALSQVISGHPLAFTPYIEPARFAAEMRNHHWKHVRESKGSSDIEPATEATPYPSKSAKIHDVPADDQGGNFGRFARTGIMDSYLTTIHERTLSGIQVKHWLTFFKAFQERTNDQQIRKQLDALADKIRSAPGEPSEAAKALSKIVEGVQHLLADNG